MISDIGNYRNLNEDSVGYFENTLMRYYVVADGMGGHNAGEIASQVAVNETIDMIKRNLQEEECDTLLVNSVKKANNEIYKLSKEKEIYKGMGTTITACLIKSDKAFIANVGDSSCIAVRENDVIKITKDHSLVQELIDSGSITEEQAVNHPNKNIITRALGTKENVDVDIYTLNLKGIRNFILCTDGLSNVVTLKEIYAVVSNYDRDKCCEELIRLSKEKGSKDNISVIVFEGEGGNDRCSRE